jgi:hypothetical protein
VRDWFSFSEELWRGKTRIKTFFLILSNIRFSFFLLLLNLNLGMTTRMVISPAEVTLDEGWGSVCRNTEGWVRAN